MGEPREWTERAEGVEVGTDDGVSYVRIDRPPRNFLIPDTMAGLAATLLEADADESVRAVVLTGSGETFCAGLDIERIRAGADPVEFAGRLVELLRLFPTLGKPVLGAVNGDALAAGYAIACACDIAVAVEEAKLGTYETSVGIWPMVAQIPALKRLQPRHALRNILTGEPYEAKRALEVGIVDEVVSRERLLPTVADYVGLVTRAPAGAIAAGRRAFYEFLDLSYDEALTEGLARFAAMFDRAPGKEEQ
jgi:enoyl-CoA hydratase/carnithine racemase